ncbi:glycosyltransferase family 4 protein [Mobilitalea sibirica]|uniref:Glycosyltransferase family 4 protein n=1 Tax=Mobilitalea sibirica TaxID=1462919 RepID=A0A8J7H790_9FIRM|nr:glycosyltransferase family 4 protein [Mobilitalea sibirica]MBH1939275.1 glycosyltransferase family 4 protein [Mobilitalea sibirica]
MNIGLFTETYYPEINGVATSVYMLKQELEKRGHNVYVFTTKTPGAPNHELNVFRVPSKPFVFISERRVGLFYQPKLAAIIRKLNLDIIHTHTEFSLGIFGRIMARELKLPIVHTYHTIYEDYTHYLTRFKALDKKAKAFARVYSKVCCNTVEQVIVPTEKTKQLLLKYSVHKEISVVPTGIDLYKFDARNYTKEKVLALKKQYKITKDNKVLLYLGRVSLEKNLEEIITAMPEYMKTREEVKFVIVGSGPALDKLQLLVKQLGIRERVIFTGSQPWDIIGLYYRLGDVFVSASQSETQGLTYIEALACGLPVVAREDKCLDNILINGQNGYTFTDKKGFYYGLDQVLFKDTKTDYSRNAIQMAKTFSSEVFAGRVEDVYKQVISRDRVYCKRPTVITKRID